MPFEGRPAPDFAAPDQRGETLRLSDLRGRWVVLYFNPRDETRGCTAEACEFRDRRDAFSRLDAEIVGVSTQDQASHAAFARRHRLPFRLVADPDKRIARAYGALGWLGVARRVTFVLDPSGVVRRVHRSELDPRGHVEAARRAIEAGRTASGVR
ncbi:MAG TPA: peroxiredoxin [Candidatus Thermoplasmatota archaeon]|nr:peroxiredoxin [Candidatus Thermoplasmatota archaeon]